MSLRDKVIEMTRKSLTGEQRIKVERLKVSTKCGCYSIRSFAGVPYFIGYLAEGKTTKRKL